MPLNDIPIRSIAKCEETLLEADSWKECGLMPSKLLNDTCFPMELFQLEIHTVITVAKSSSNFSSCCL